MGVEIERKFLVTNDSYKINATSKMYKQGYITTENKTTVRFRTEQNKGYITIKGKSKGLARPEYEYEIPVGDANEILESLCVRPFIEKRRYFVEYQGFTWEVDEFHGDNEGLVVAEIELDSEDAKFPVPDWIGEEVTMYKRYTNLNLVSNPFKNWR